MRCRIALWLVPAAAMALSGCSGLLRWDAPPRQSAGRATAARPATSAAPPAVRVAGADEYRVHSGDTLYSIAFRHQLDYRELARWNGIGADYRIDPGQVLRLRPATASAAARPAVAAADTVVIGPAAPAPLAGAAGVAAGTTKPVSAAPAAGEAPQGFEWLWPTTGTIQRNYAPKDGFKGLDFGGNLGQPVFAAAPGRVVYSGNALKGYGELIIIKHNDAYLSAYGYNRKRNVSEGDVVTAGQPIAELGLGPENKPFLHFEIRERGQPVDPMRFLPKRETTPGAK